MSIINPGISFCEVRDTWATSNYEETSESPRLRTILQNSWPVIVKVVRVLEVKESWEYPRLEVCDS